MLDIKFIRENIDLIKEAVQKKHVKFDVDALVKIDDERKATTQKTDDLRAEQNKMSEKIVAESSKDKKNEMIAEMKVVKGELLRFEQKLKGIMEIWRELMLRVPNIPDIEVPEGNSDAENKEIKVWGEKPKFSFEPKDHITLMLERGLVDFERGTKVHGFRGYFLTGVGVELSFAIWNYAMKFFSAKGFMPVIPPTIVRKQNLYGTAHLPGDVEDYYMTQDGDALAGTAEVPLMGMYADEVLKLEDLPKKILGFSPCFRREAGSHGRDVSGLIRVNEFYKLEQVILCEASHEASVAFHSEINGNTEEFIETLGLPYQTVINCGGDLGLGQVKKYDINLWVPKEGKYREISSASYFHDFQTRRFNTRYRDSDGVLRFVHSLNCTAVPTPRLLVALVENFQTKDGTIKIPEALRPFMGGREFI